MRIVVESYKTGTPVTIVHGGAGAKRNPNAEVWEVLRKAAIVGLEKASTDPLEATVLSVEVLEDSCLLNAGRGSVLDYNGGISMDAGIMDGVSVKYGAVAGVKYPLHPIRLAYIVMEETAHNFLVGMEADLLAARMGLKRHPGPCDNRVEQWVTARSKPLPKHLGLNKHLVEGDTVGSVVVGENKAVVGVSTGGIFLKLPGRVGDSPLIGSGFYSTGKVGVVATGLGEIISRGLLSYRIASAYESSGEEGVRREFERFTEKYGLGTAGFILGSIEGEVVAGYNTEFMPWTYCSEGRCVNNRG
ncbi:MAG: isoaspartyl peptidase/L-asparaginase [Desulfurococcales archaeon]|nr:isoaspartyl peptidase/L-asparaginase [Desulfurococcales archaeon]